MSGRGRNRPGARPPPRADISTTLNATQGHREMWAGRGSCSMDVSRAAEEPVRHRQPCDKFIAVENSFKLRNHEIIFLNTLMK